MKKIYYLTFAFLFCLISVGAYSQALIETDYVVEFPFDESDYAGETQVIISDATVTFTADAFNTCGLPFGTGTLITMEEGAVIIMYDSPETWFPDADAEENADYIDYLTDSEGQKVTSVPFNFLINGNSRIVLDSKCRFGGTITGSGNLTLVVGDSTILDSDLGISSLGEFTGTLTIEVKEGNNQLLIGSTYPGTCPIDNVTYNNASARCYHSIPWTLVLPDGIHVYTHDKTHTCFPRTIGHAYVHCSSTCTFRSNQLHLYDLEIDGGADNRNFEMYSVGQGFNYPVNYLGAYAYVRTGALYVNGNEASFSNIINRISIRGREMFVGGVGFIDCTVEGKAGTTAHIKPGATGENDIGTLTILKELYLNSNNSVDIDFGPGGKSDKLILVGGGAFSGEFTRLWVNIMDDFYDNPVAGDYKVLDAPTLRMNEVPVLDTVFTGTFTTTIDSIYSGDTLIRVDTIVTADIERIDTIGWEISNNLVVNANQLQTGQHKDSLPEGYAYNFDRFFSDGIIAITGPGYVEGNIVNGPSGVNQVKLPDKFVRQREIFNLTGIRTKTLTRGINIIRTTYSDGSVEVQKFYYEE
jgi:hypothetical protein